jgi:hypothetical protein
MRGTTQIEDNLFHSKIDNGSNPFTITKDYLFIVKAPGGNSPLLYAPAHSKRRLSLAGIEVLLISHQSFYSFHVNIAFLSYSTKIVKLKQGNM